MKEEVGFFVKEGESENNDSQTSSMTIEDPITMIQMTKERAIEEKVVTINLKLKVSWTEKQREDAIQRLKKQSVLSVYHFYDQRIPYSTLRSWRGRKDSKRKHGSDRNLTN